MMLCDDRSDADDDSGGDADDCPHQVEWDSLALISDVGLEGLLTCLTHKQHDFWAVS